MVTGLLNSSTHDNMYRRHGKSRNNGTSESDVGGFSWKT